MREFILYKCGFKDCDKVSRCQIGYHARVTCKHPDADGNEREWYPIRPFKVVRE